MPDQPEPLSNEQVIDQWVSAREPAAAPEATTPAPEASTPSPAPAADVASAEPVGTPDEKPRDHAGRFVSTTVTPPSLTPPAPDVRSAEPVRPAAPTAPAQATAPAPGATAQQVQEYIEAFIDGQTEPLKIPKGAKLSLKRGTETELLPIEEVHKRGMFEKDYRHKTAELAQERRTLAVERGWFDARKQALDDEAARLREATTNPEKLAEFEEHQRQYASNPWYKKMVDDALAKRETDAELAVYQQENARAQTEQGIQTVMEWLDDFATRPEYKGVDKDRVRVTYAQMLQSGQAGLDRTTVERLFAQEADYLRRSVSPIEQQVAELKAQIEELKSATAAGSHNARTQHAIDRAKAPPIATGGQPPAPRTVNKPSRFGIQDLAERNAAWAAQRD